MRKLLSVQSHIPEKTGKAKATCTCQNTKDFKIAKKLLHFLDSLHIPLTIWDHNKAVIGIFTVNSFIHIQKRQCSLQNREPQKTCRSITANTNDTWTGQDYHLTISKQNERHLVAIIYWFHFAIHKVVYSSHVFIFALWVEHTTFKLDYFSFHST